MILDTRRVARELLDAYDHARLIDPPSRRGPFAVADAYAVCAELVALRRARGERTVGRKIGFTNTGIWAEYGVDRPMWAHVYAGTVLRAPGGAATLSLAGMVAPRIEPEVVFGLAAPVEPGTTDPSELLRRIAWLAPGFEVVDCHFPGWRFTSADCTADFGLHARLAIGPPLAVAPGAADALVEQLARFTLALWRDGEVAATGGGANVLGSPLLALGYLVETLAAQGGEPLAAGEVVTTGTLTPALPIRPGETWRWEAAGIPLGGLALTLA
jgi:2-oxo-3-hexenedioate decarboxylase